MAQQWHKGKFVIIGLAAAGLAVLAGLALAYSSGPAPEESDDKEDTPPEETQNEEPKSEEVGPPTPPDRPGLLSSTGAGRVWVGVGSAAQSLGTSGRPDRLASRAPSLPGRTRAYGC